MTTSIEERERAGRPLSAQERRVLAHHGEGKVDKEIAAAMGISLGSVRVYWRRSRAKLGTNTQTTCVLAAIRRGEIQVAGVGRAAA